MKYLLLNLAVFCLVLVKSEVVNQNNIVFELADLTIDYEMNNELVHLEAFKTKSNDDIIKSKKIEDYGKLYWVSIGHPRIESRLNFLRFAFEFRVSLLTTQLQNLFVDVVKRKYGISIHPEQIVNLKPNKFECSIHFFDEDKWFRLNGKAEDFNVYPLKVIFPFGFKSIEKEKLYNRILKNSSLDINCEFSSEGQVLKKNTLIISAKQFNLLNLNDEIFGPKDQVYITRNQISSLAHELY
ncbi:unnamed protein product, partial [Brachionus calyciflorus]